MSFNLDNVKKAFLIVFWWDLMLLFPEWCFSIVETRKQLKVIICQQKCISPRTSRHTLDPPNSKMIYSHSFEENHLVYEDDFKIVARSPEKHLRLLESISIHDFKPCLYDQHSCYLNILGWFFSLIINSLNFEKICT